MNNDASGRAMPVAMTIRHEQIQDLDDTIAAQSKKIAEKRGQRQLEKWRDSIAHFVDQSIFQSWLEFETPHGRIRAEDKGSFWQIYQGVDEDQGGAYSFVAIDQLPTTATDTPESLYNQLTELTQ
tara:strand:+ start:557 stop:931 length:375 start_codon:yes stop_codon:yes gene_type:complete